MNTLSPNGKALCWINLLQPAQRALARTVQQYGLVGQPVGSGEFAWRRDGELVASSGQQATLSEAFDLAVQHLPSRYTTSPD